MPDAKADLRRRLRDARARRDDRALGAVAGALARAAATIDAATVAAFVGVRTEPPTLPLLDALHARGVRVLLPRLLDDLDLDWGVYTGADALVDGPRGMREPGGPALGRDAIATADLVLVPALAVDGSGRRLGQGGGSYDRALPRTTAPVIAIVFDDEVLDEVPAEPHDRPVDGVLTPGRGLRRLRESGDGGGR